MVPRLEVARIPLAAPARPSDLRPPFLSPPSRPLLAFSLRPLEFCGPHESPNPTSGFSEPNYAKAENANHFATVFSLVAPKTIPEEAKSRGEQRTKRLDD